MNTIVTVPSEVIINKILLIRSTKVMLDSDLAELYQVPTKRLNEQVRRNLARFPSDFMFQLSSLETLDVNRSQFATGSQKHRDPRFSPYVFTEQGVAMLSSVLNSPKAVQVNIQIIRTFTKLREILADNKKLAEKMERLEQRYDKQICHIFSIINELRIKSEKPAEIAKPKEKIGFRLPGQ